MARIYLIYTQTTCVGKAMKEITIIVTCFNFFYRHDWNGLI